MLEHKLSEEMTEAVYINSELQTITTRVNNIFVYMVSYVETKDLFFLDASKEQLTAIIRRAEKAIARIDKVLEKGGNRNVRAKNQNY